MSLVTRSARRQDTVVDGTLLDAQGTNTNGVWYSLERTRPFSYTVRGTFGTATVTIYVSDQVVKPADADVAQAVHATFTTPGSNGSDYSFRWIKAAVTGAGGGTSVTVDLQGG